MRLIDSHVHIFPDAVATKAVSSLALAGGIRAHLGGRRSDLLAEMARCGIMAALNCPIATKPEQVVSVNQWVAQGNQFPLFSLGTAHPDFPEVEEELRRLRVLGLPGIKLHPEYQAFGLLEARLAPVWRGCSDLGLVAVLHAGGDFSFPPPWRTCPADFARLAVRWPTLKLVAAHFGGWRLWDEVERDLVGAPVWLDLSFTDEIDDARLTAMIRRHGANRVLFASDSPWNGLDAAVSRFMRLPLTALERELIGWRNAVELFGLQLPE